MSEYPDPDEEFELQYGDEFELLNQQEDFDDEPILTIQEPSKSRKSLDYGERSNHTQSDLFPSQTQQQNTLENLFDSDFHPISDRSLNDVPNSVTTETSQVEGIQSNNAPKKRTIEELFGDIDDLLFKNERKSKKSKASTKYEEQMEMIETILEMRRLKKENENALFSRSAPVLTSDERNKLNISWRVPSYPFVSITRHDQEKVYIRCHSEKYEKEDVERVIKEVNLVGVMGDMFKETWKKAQEIMNKQMDDQVNQIGDIPMDVDLEDDQNLWTDLYRPKRYLELLSDETTNRVLLKWLKLWDKVVFNRRPKIRVPKAVEGKPWMNKANFIMEEQLKLDEDGRPHLKIALLCGRPGLGKTTLAHVVAKHAGYNVIEINASDDRSLDFFRTSLENATQMSSVIDQEKRPNCVVFDEIDGAPSQSIDFLVKFVSGTASKSKKKGNAGNAVLKRPIICICNDAYVPALRSLRQIAFVVNFPPTSSARLCERLLQIARKQHLNTDNGTMLALAEKSNNDIRSCLSILHFHKAQKKPITLSDIYRSSIGQKDMQKGLFSVWQDIFSIERNKIKTFSMENVPKEDRLEEYDMSNKSRMQKILRVVQSFGDYDRLAQGVFENFPEMQIKESSLHGTCYSLDWFCYSDNLNKNIMNQQNYSLGVYLPYAFVVWHFCFSSLTWTQMKYPNKGYEVRQKLTNNLATIKEQEKGIPPKTKIYVNTKTLLLDILPPLTRIISPPLRPVNLHLFTAKEKETFAHVVDIMIDYNLNYVQEKRADGIYDFNLDPDVLPVVTYFDIPVQERRSMSYFNKQLIAREVEMGKIRKLQTSSSEKEQENPEKTKKVRTSPLMSPEEMKNLPNHLQRLKVKKMKRVEPATTKDFFGRVITRNDEDQTGVKGAAVKQEVWFKYKEGYSNAVRKKIKMSEL